MKVKRIYLKWKDHASAIGWFEDASHPDIGIAIVESIGFLVHEDKDKLVISHSVCSEGAYADPISILKSCVVKRRAL